MEIPINLEDKERLPVTTKAKSRRHLKSTWQCPKSK
jgi:hypothetical protein